MLLRQALVALAVCAVTPAQAQPANVGATPVDVPAAIRGAVKLEPAALLDGAQLSPLRTTSGPQLGDALACLKLAGAPGGYIAVFFEGGKVLSYRRAVAFDRCGEGPFSQLAPAPAPKARTARTGRPHAPRPIGEAAAKP